MPEKEYESHGTSAQVVEGCVSHRLCNHCDDLLSAPCYLIFRLLLPILQVTVLGPTQPFVQ